ncbi:MAG: hypothetical protein ACJ742_06160 [Actinomycetes bacterium]|jgi:hypothetical protein
MRHATPPATAHLTALKLGAVCAVLGGLAIAGFRLLHGDLPAADAPAALAFITRHPFYAGIHIGTILGVLVWAGGIVALSGTLTSGQAGILGRVGTASVLVGAAVFIVDFSIDGVAGQDLATAWQAAPPAERPELELAARTAFTILRGTSLTSILILWGIPLLLLGRALLLEAYPAWLSWTGMAIGAVIIPAALALLLREDLFPGVLLYGLLISILVPLWSLALGLAMWRRATATHG